MKKEIPSDIFERAVFLTQPGRPILCTTRNEDGSNHVAPFTWFNPISFKPPQMALALLNTPQKKQHTLINIERTGEFIANLPDMELTEQLVLSSYLVLKGENKFDRSGLTPHPGKEVDVVAIQECRSHVECKVYDIIKTGDHSLVLADVVAAYYDEAAFTKNLMIDLKNYKPMLHLQNFCSDPKDPWNLNPGQVHVFMEPGGAYVADVPYP